MPKIWIRRLKSIQTVRILIVIQYLNRYSLIWICVKHLKQIDTANYDDIMPKGEISHYDIMRYFVAIGRADAAAKFFVDKFNLPAQDALQYLLAI